MIDEYSIGAVVIYQELYLLLQYSSGHWGFVKGHKEGRESDEETILRELEEETGIEDAKIIPGFQDSMQYYYRLHNQLVRKRVKFYLIEVDEKKVKLSFEHEDFIWLPFKKALKKATFKNAKKIIKKAHFFLESTLKSYI